MGDMADFIIDRNINYVDWEMMADNEEALLAEDAFGIDPEYPVTPAEEADRREAGGL